MTGWPAYPGGAQGRDPGAAPVAHAPLGAPPGPTLNGLGLGARFDDTTWSRLLQARGWVRTAVGPCDGWLSPALPGLRLLFACPRLDVTGLDSSVLYVGFRADDSDADEIYRVHGGGDGELIFDHLVHADGHFDRAAFLRWIERESMASLRRI